MATEQPGKRPVIPVEHYENIFDLPVDLGTPIQRAARSAAQAMKDAFGCDGISTRQHNEPAGNQGVLHYHLHVLPRWEGDDLYRMPGAMAPPGEVRRRANQLRAAWPQGLRGLRPHGSPDAALIGRAASSWLIGAELLARRLLNLEVANGTPVPSP